MSSFAARASLRADQGYLAFLDHQSRTPGEYYTTQFRTPPAPQDCARDACAQFHVGPSQVAADAELHLGDSTRTRVRASQVQPQTELFGVAPYTVTGRGELLYTDASSSLRLGAVTQKRGCKAQSHETSWARYDFGIEAPAAEPFGSRIGAITNMDREYAQA